MLRTSESASKECFKLHESTNTAPVGNLNSATVSFLWDSEIALRYCRQVLCFCSKLHMKCWTLELNRKTSQSHFLFKNAEKSSNTLVIFQGIFFPVSKSFFWHFVQSSKYEYFEICFTRSSSINYFIRYTGMLHYWFYY